MATSSITANFYTEDSKAANAFVEMLFASKPTVKPRKTRVRVVSIADPEVRKAFIRGFAPKRIVKDRV